jgi:hypothetical protein
MRGVSRLAFMFLVLPLCTLSGVLGGCAAERRDWPTPRANASDTAGTAGTVEAGGTSGRSDPDAAPCDGCGGTRQDRGTAGTSEAGRGGVIEQSSAKGGSKSVAEQDTGGAQSVANGGSSNEQRGGSSGSGGLTVQQAGGPSGLVTGGGAHTGGGDHQTGASGGAPSGAAGEGGTGRLGHGEAGTPASAIAGAAGEPASHTRVGCDPDDTPTHDALFVGVGDAGEVAAAGAGGDGPVGELGTGDRPYRSIAEALSRASDKGITTIYVAEGEYPGSLRVTADLWPDRPGQKTIVISGGWLLQDGQWKRDCRTDARTYTVIQPPDDGTSACMGGLIEDNEVRLETLTVKTQPQGATRDGQDGESCYGLKVDGSAKVELDDVVVEAGDGGDGGVVTETVPSEEPVCLTVKSDGSVPLNTGTGDTLVGCSNGASGAPGVHGEDGARGWFTAEGYQPASGTDGTPGKQGENGTHGGSRASGQCTQGCSQVSQSSCGDVSASFPAATGTCGCGGRGGPAGLGGRGGGASVALFVSSSDAMVSVTSSELVAGQGGQGSPGVAGDGGLLGSEGNPAGSTVQCSGCRGAASPPCTSYAESRGTIPPAAAGGPGGPGGPGGNGGGGSGGPSIGFVVPFDWEPEATRVITSSPGWGADGAADGAELSQWML